MLCEKMNHMKCLLFITITISSLIIEASNGIIGIIKTNDGTPIPGIQATLSNKNMPSIIKTTSKNGKFRFFQLPSGKYHLRISCPGLQEIHWDIDICCNKTIDIDFSYPDFGGIWDPVTIYIPSPMIEKRNSSIAYCFTKEQLRLLPIDR